MTYAFVFDASACTGCKACQAACKDKNNLPMGVLWRRVYEISGGSWQQMDSGWVNNVFAYNITIACNHCVHPKCAGVCPVNAYQVRDDGIVILNSSKCIGCGYCNWACPYSVPQYDHTAGVMTKCNFCIDSVDAGDAPACVKACPMRVLGFTDLNDHGIETAGIALWEVPASAHPFPLPKYSRTQPHVLLRAHSGMSAEAEGRVANYEEIKPGKAKSELPLVFFSLLVQMAVGISWATKWMFTPIFEQAMPYSKFWRSLPDLIIGASILFGMSASFAHLGAKRNAWRIFANLQKSWLSKEILYLGLFCISWLLWLVTQHSILGWLTSLVGIGFVHSMWSVYRLRSMPVWNQRNTLVAFLITALLLGHWVLVPVLLIESILVGIHLPELYTGWIACLTVPFMAGELALIFQNRQERITNLEMLRVGLILLVSACLTLFVFLPGLGYLWFGIAIFVVLFVEEAIGRWLFYTELDRRTM